VLPTQSYLSIYLSLWWGPLVYINYPWHPPTGDFSTGRVAVLHTRVLGRYLTSMMVLTAHYWKLWWNWFLANSKVSQIQLYCYLCWYNLVTVVSHEQEILLFICMTSLPLYLILDYQTWYAACLFDLPYKSLNRISAALSLWLLLPRCHVIWDLMLKCLGIAGPFLSVSVHQHSWKVKTNMEIQNECEPCSLRAGAASWTQ